MPISKLQSDILRLIAAKRDPESFVAEAARALESPSSAMRALAAGAVHIERVDKLVAAIAAHLGRPIQGVDAIVTRVDALIARNLAEAA